MRPSPLPTIERLAGPLTAVMGAAELAASVVGLPALTGTFPGSPAMKANTALGFILSGAAFWIAGSEGGGRKTRMAASAGSALVLLACGSTLLEYLTGWNLGIDEALIEDKASSVAAYPGRMAPNSALAFVLLSIALLMLLRPGEPKRSRLSQAGLLGVLAALLGLFAVTGHLGNVGIGYGWSDLTFMTFRTGLGFALLGTACLVLAWRRAGSRLAIGGRRLAGFLSGLAVFVALGVLSYKSAQQFADTASWVRHTIEVLAKLQEANAHLTRLQTTVRGFVITGREDFLEPYRGGLEALREDQKELRRLTSDNPLQQERLAALEGLIDQRTAFSTASVELYRREGFAPAAALIATGRGQEIMDRIGVVIDALSRTERELLARREAANRDLTTRTFMTLPVGTFIGMSVLLAVLFSLNAEAAERHQAEAASRTAAAIVESTADAVITKSLRGIITSWNPAAERMFGYTALEAIGQPILMVIPAERSHEEEGILTRIGRGERVEHFETVRVRKDGRRMDASVTVSPLRDHGGRIVGASKIVRDITERRAADEALRALGLRLTNTLENMDAAFFTVDHDWHFTYLNRECERLLHCPREDLLGRVLWEEFKEAIGGPSDLNYHRAMAESRAVSFEEFYPPLGMWLEVRAYPSSDGLAVYFRDATERKRTEQALRESEERFRFLNDLVEATRTLADPAQIMAVMAWMLGEHLHASRCAYANVEADGDRFTIVHDYTDGCASTVGSYQLALFGGRALATLRSGETLIIRSVDEELLPGEGADMFNAIGIKAIITCPLVKEGGLRAMMAVHQESPRDWQPGEIAIVQDVVERCWATIERRAAEDRVQHLNAELEQRVVARTAELEVANKELEAFSYSVSHDLRAPLRTVDGFSQALLEDFGPELPEDGQRQVRTIRQAAQRMGALIDDLLAFSHLGRQPLSKRPAVDMNGLVREALEDLVPDRGDRQVEIRVGPLASCSGDPALVKQVWANLLSNAIKYTRKCHPAVVEVGCESADGEAVYFVRDNGTGFDMRYANKLFGVFQRLHRAEDFEGTGVGLAIVQRIVHRHGGRVWADAAVNEGATFRFTLSKRSE